MHHFPMGKETLVSTEQEAGLSPSQPGCIGGDKHLTLEGIELRFRSFPAHSLISVKNYTDLLYWS
jgi:hypothetical protein